jgi:hypothetical protein
MSPRLYLVALAVGALCGVAYGALRIFVLGPDAMLGCDPRGVDATHYMAYCNVRSFTEYDLGAHYFGLEPAAIKSMQAADVLFVGDSRTGHTFSSKATQDFMERLHATYYIMGFGYEASSTAALSLIEKYQLRPKLMIVNADPFFTNDFREVRERILSGRYDIYLEYFFKKQFQRLQASLCSRNERFCGHALTVYRSVVNGAWDVRQFAALHPGSKNPKIVIEDDKNRSSEIPEALKAGREFIEHVSIAPGCLIVTSVPSPHSTQDLAKAVAAELDAPYIAPEIAGLRTFDDSHLTMEDSERWSSEMLRQASDQIRRCLR